MKPFFFDTANIPFISETWNKLKKTVNSDSVLGITTNPSAFSKINKFELSDWFETTKELVKLVTSIREDSFGEVHIQIPNSNMPYEKILNYAAKVSDLSDGKTQIYLKIPPRTDILDRLGELNNITPTNVTGLADHATALKCTSFFPNNPYYISIIPGRMEEVGIDAKSVISFLQECHHRTNIITGSQRTLDQVVWAYQYDTIPTIGEKVWDIILSDDNLRDLKDRSSIKFIFESKLFSPIIEQKNIDLSVAFFEQMDNLGKVAYISL